MKQLNEIKGLEQLKGKTILETVLYCDELYIKFSDNSFAVLVPKNITEGFGQTRHEVNINNYPKDATDLPLLQLGIITQVEYNKACEEEKLEYEQWVEEREKKELERIKQIELDQLKKLSDKYNK